MRASLIEGVLIQVSSKNYLKEALGHRSLKFGQTDIDYTSVHER
jgi:hypothetical protein